jgi:hypothetical protein
MSYGHWPVGELQNVTGVRLLLIPLIILFTIAGFPFAYDESDDPDDPEFVEESVGGGGGGASTDAGSDVGAAGGIPTVPSANNEH